MINSKRNLIRYLNVLSFTSIHEIVRQNQAENQNSWFATKTRVEKSLVFTTYTKCKGETKKKKKKKEKKK